MTEFLKYYLPFFLLAYLLVTFVFPSVRVYRQTGINPITFGKSDNAHDYIGFIMKVVIGLLILAVLLYSLSETAYKFLVPILYLEQNFLKYTGLILIHASLVWIIVAQNHMKHSWRIGVDEKTESELITKGLFSFSRNPIFLGMICTTACVFLIIPNSLTLVTMATTYIVIQIQVRLEEEHLSKQHGMNYKKYKERVNRFISF